MRATAVLVFVASLFAAVKCQQSGSIRLYNYGYSNSSTSGIVEVYYSGQWNTICRYNPSGFQYWGWNEAYVACQQLGYSGASSYSYSGLTNYGDDPTAIGLNGVSCASSSYLVLLQCSFNTGSTSVCSSDDKVTVGCYTTLLTASPYSGMVRLQGGAYVNSGRAEVYCNGQWGTLCDNPAFTSMDSVAETVCYQLGYNNDYSYSAGTIPGSSQPIWLSDYNCYIGYSCISSCQTCPATSSSNCDHSQDLYVACEYNTAYFKNGVSLYTCTYYWSTGLIVGVVFGVLAAIALCLCLFIGIPVCICCCLGIGIGSVAGAGRHHHHYDTV